MHRDLVSRQQTDLRLEKVAGQQDKKEAKGSRSWMAICAASAFCVMKDVFGMADARIMTQM